MNYIINNKTKFEKNKYIPNNQTIILKKSINQNNQNVNTLNPISIPAINANFSSWKLKLPYTVDFKLKNYQNVNSIINLKKTQ